ncbi:tetratricopeptide repeat protein [candidate division KSB1 bacterium]
MKLKNYALPLVCAYLLFILMQALPLLFDIPEFWGMDQWSYFSKPAVFLFFLLCLIPVFSPFRNLMVKAANIVISLNPVKRVGSVHSSAVLLPLIFAAGMFWFFRQGTHFLGDGYLWARDMSVIRLDFKEFLGALIYSGLHRIFSVSLLQVSPGAETAASLIAIASGIVFLIFTYKSARAISGNVKERIFIFLTLLSTGTVTLFFGYVEVYPPLAAGVMAFIYYGVRFCRENSGAKALVLVFLLNCAIHLSAVALLPALLIVFMYRKFNLSGAKRVLLATAAGMPLGIAALWAAQELNILSGFFHQYFLPVSTSLMHEKSAGTIVSTDNFIDLANFLLLVCPVIILALPVLIRPDLRVLRRNMQEFRIVLFLGTAGFFYIVEFLIFNKMLGASRDWDIFSPAAFPIALFGAITLVKRYGKIVESLIVFTAFVMLAHTGTWIYINSSPEKSVNRFSALAETGRWTGFAKGYAFSELASYHYNNGESIKALDCSLAASRCLPDNLRYKFNVGFMFQLNGMITQAEQTYISIIKDDPDYLDAHRNLAFIYYERHNDEPAEYEIKETLRIDPADDASYNLLALVYLRNGRIDEAIAAGEKSIVLNPYNDRYYSSLGSIYSAKGDIVSAVKNFQTAILLNGENTSALTGLGNIHYAGEQWEQAVHLYNRSTHLDPENPEVYIRLAIAYYNLKNYSLSWLNVIRAESLHAAPPEGFLTKLSQVLPRPD